MPLSRKKRMTICGTHPRAWTELAQADPIRIRFCYPCGYSTVVEVEKDKSLKRIAPALLRRFAASYWSKGNNGVADECPKCRRAALKAEREKTAARVPGRLRA